MVKKIKADWDDGIDEIDEEERLIEIKNQEMIETMKELKTGSVADWEAKQKLTISSKDWVIQLKKTSGHTLTL